VDPSVAGSVLALGIEGVYLQREYRRYYPMGEVTAHVVGFTNIDDVGQEGIELAFDEALRGVGGSKRVLRDRIGQVVADVERIRDPKSGRDLVLSIDRRIQYRAYRALLAAVNRNQARAGSVVVLDARNGEVLAMVNQPSYNPNNRAERIGSRSRNRAVTDVFEPGSAVKPFTIAAALDSGQFRSDTVVDTSPGYMKVGKYTIKDVRNYGRIDLSTIVKKSSNVGASKVALSLQPRDVWQTLSRFGFGLSTGSGFPGETDGVLTHYFEWREAHRATLSYGYGFSVTALQLAQAYAAIANGGMLSNAGFLPAESGMVGTRAVSEDVALQLRRMLESAVSPGGTGSRARIEGFRVAGKTGTVRKATSGGYSEDRYIAIFVGMAPISSPRIVTVVVIDEPSAGEYYGGRVAAPVFADVTEGALRLLGVAPDDRGLPTRRMVTAGAAVSRDQSANTGLTRIALHKDRRDPEARQ
jgi:cell division protein FtsI (penicillin-binding protein 3)